MIGLGAGPFGGEAGDLEVAGGVGGCEGAGDVGVERDRLPGDAGGGLHGRGVGVDVEGEAAAWEIDRAGGSAAVSGPALRARVVARALRGPVMSARRASGPRAGSLAAVAARPPSGSVAARWASMVSAVTAAVTS